MDEGRTDKKKREKRSVWCFNETEDNQLSLTLWQDNKKRWTTGSATVTWRSKVMVFQRRYTGITDAPHRHNKKEKCRAASPAA